MLKVYFIVQVPIKKESSLEQENKVSVTSIVGSTLGLTDQDFFIAISTLSSIDQDCNISKNLKHEKAHNLLISQFMVLFLWYLKDIISYT